MKKIVKETNDMSVYIGVSVGNRLLSGTVFPCSPEYVPERLGSLVEEYPEIRHLVVSMRDLPQAKADIARPGTALHYYNERLKKKVAETR